MRLTEIGKKVYTVKFVNVEESSMRPHEERAINVTKRPTFAQNEKLYFFKVANQLKN